MALAELAPASVCFAARGVFMKLSAGVSRAGPTAAFLALFLAGALLQGLAMRRADLGVAYILVLGLEAVPAFGFSVLLFRESASPARVAAVALILAGILLLRRT
jgi:multidrug transporter EmrE-like cation transporter